MPIILLIALISSAFACEKEAIKFLKQSAPVNSDIKVIDAGPEKISYSIDAKNYQESGTLQVKKSSPCEFTSLSKQVQSSGSISGSTEEKLEAIIDVTKLNGSWSSSCTQTQTNERQGYVTEKYTISEGNNFTLDRDWHKQRECKGKAFHKDNEKGHFEIGKQNTNNGFNPAGTYEAIFRVGRAADQGLIWVSDDYTYLRLSRGFGGSPNTMLSLTEYRRK